MGVIKLSFQLFAYTAIFLAVILFVPGLPPHIDYPSFTLPPRQKLEGKYAPNAILDGAELVVDGIAGPESVEIRGDEVFTGVEGGKIVKVKNGKVTTVVQLGTDCDNRWDESKCGRPLGLRFDNQGKLLVADVFLGIFKVDVDKGTAENIIPMTTEIVGGSGRPPRFPDDLDVDKDGNIYWSDLSEHGTFDNQGLVLLGPPSGRLLQYNPKTKKNIVLIDKLHLANGVQLSRNEDFVTVVETALQRVWKYYLKGPKKGQKEILVDNLPGVPDNIRSNGKGGFYISHFVSKEETETNAKPTFQEFSASVPLARKLVLRLQSLILTLVSSINSVWQNDIFEEAKIYIKNMGPLLKSSFFPTRVIIVEVNESGEILGSLQTKDNRKMLFISQITVGDPYSYFGSPMTSQLWRIKTTSLK